MGWNLRYASHLGFRSLDLPLFAASVGSSDPVDHIAYAAALGFAGVQDPWFATRPHLAQDRIAAAIAECGLAVGCIVCGPLDVVRSPLWNRVGAAARATLEAHLGAAVEAALRIGGRQIAILTGDDPGSPRARQTTAMTDNLRWAATVAESEGLVLCLEATNARTLPGMFLNHIGQAAELVRAVDRPSVRLIFDTAHVQSMDGDLLTHMERHWGQVAIVQIANHPSRFESEAGEISMGAVLRKIWALGYRGLVELEHNWSKRCGDRAGGP
jgi:hydroxypyruvate isomerase